MSERTIIFPTEQVHEVQISTLQKVSERHVDELSILMNCLKPDTNNIETLSHRWLDRIVMSPDRDIVIAQEQSSDRILGTLTLNAVIEPSPSGSYVHIGGVAVHPDARGQRLTSRMLGFADAWAEARGLSVLRLFTEESKTPAIRAYASWGATQEESNSRGERRLFFVKRLDK